MHRARHGGIRGRLETMSGRLGEIMVTPHRVCEGWSWRGLPSNGSLRLNYSVFYN